MIIPEQLCKQIFSQIPPVQGQVDGKQYEVRYSWGGEKDLNPYLLTISGNKYPLIWLVEGTDDVEISAHVLRRRIKLFIAKNSPDINALNPTVWNTEFENVLDPLLAKVITCFRKSGVTTILNDKYKVSRRANYTEVDNTKQSKSATIDHWNVIVLECEVEFTEKPDGTPNCINKIKF